MLKVKFHAFSSSDQYVCGAAAAVRPDMEFIQFLTHSGLANSQRSQSGLSYQGGVLPNPQRKVDHLCSNCGKSFSYSRSLKRHKWRCLGLRCLSCHVCGHVSHRLDLHKGHMSKIHGIILLE